VRLQQAGFDDFVLIDRAGDVGGVWRDNTVIRVLLVDDQALVRRWSSTLTATPHRLIPSAGGR
jgi:cation diffusion facilitator CzcD-associated flavoprotein CzcO